MQILLTIIFYHASSSTPAVITQIFHPAAELVIPLGTPTKEAKNRNGSTSSNCRN